MNRHLQTLAFALLLGGCGGESIPSATPATSTDTQSYTESNQSAATATASDDTQSDTTPQSSYQSYFINMDKCDQVVDKSYILICYDYSYKAALSVGYTLKGNLVNDPNIDERPPFYEEPLIPEAFRAAYTDYTNSGYDRGHLAPDASFDWSETSLNAVYTLANIIPQVPTVNRYQWVDVEEYGRDMAVELGEVGVLDIVRYPASPSTIGANQIAVSAGYYKVLYSYGNSYEECFYYANDPGASAQGDTLDDHRIDCSQVDY